MLFHFNLRLYAPYKYISFAPLHCLLCRCVGVCVFCTRVLSERLVFVWLWRWCCCCCGSRRELSRNNKLLCAQQTHRMQLHFKHFMQIYSRIKYKFPTSHLINLFISHASCCMNATKWSLCAIRSSFYMIAKVGVKVRQEIERRWEKMKEENVWF